MKPNIVSKGEQDALLAPMQTNDAHCSCSECLAKEAALKQQEDLTDIYRDLVQAQRKEIAVLSSPPNFSAVTALKLVYSG